MQLNRYFNMYTRLLGRYLINDKSCVVMEDPSRGELSVGNITNNNSNLAQPVSNRDCEPSLISSGVTAEDGPCSLPCQVTQDSDSDGK